MQQPERLRDEQNRRMRSGTFAAESDKTVASRERAERRRSVLRTVRETRERLTSGEDSRPAFDYELALTFARNRISAAFTIPLLIIIVAAAALLWVDPRLVAAWTALVLATHIAYAGALPPVRDHPAR